MAYSRAYLLLLVTLAVPIALGERTPHQAAPPSPLFEVRYCLDDAVGYSDYVLSGGAEGPWAVPEPDVAVPSRTTSRAERRRRNEQKASEAMLGFYSAEVAGVFA